MPKVSVIVTTYNRKEYLKEAIQSILNQTFQDFELIVVDNYSNYDFFDFIESFKSEKIIAMQNPNNGIIAINRNFGIKSAKGQYIAFCDDDDLWSPVNLQTKMNYFVNDDSIGMITSKEEIIDEKGENTGKTTQHWVKQSHFATFKDFFLQNLGSPSAAVIKKDCYTEVGYFDESVNKKYIEDIDYWMRLSLKYKVYYLNDILGSFRVHKNNASYLDATPILNSYFLRLEFISKYKNEISKFTRDAQNHIRKSKLRIALFYLKRKNLKESVKWLLKFFFE